MDRLPPVWLEVLAKVKEISPSAMIAGGALRDLVMDKLVKDVDIFAGPQLSLVQLREKFPGVEFRSVEPAGGMYEGTFRSDLFGVLDAEINGVKYQFISLKDRLAPQQLLDKFDWGINKLALYLDTRGQPVFYTHPDFVHDRENKVFTLHNAHTKNNSIRRWKRQLHKYPWPAVMPDGSKVEEDQSEEIPF